jgi:RNA polymerase sigma factor (sigma-70 family)
MRHRGWHRTSDADLVDLVRTGDERAFEAIVNRFRPSLLRYCRRLVTDSLAEDAVQETFVHAYHGIRRAECELRLRPWLYRIAFNVSVDVLRAERWRSEVPMLGPLEEEPPLHVLERREYVGTVLSALLALPPRQRDALVLQAFDGRRNDEIAVHLGTSEKAVRQLLNRARITLREQVRWASGGAAQTAGPRARRLDRRSGERRRTPAGRRRGERRGAARGGQRACDRAESERRTQERRGSERRAEERRGSERRAAERRGSERRTRERRGSPGPSRGPRPAAAPGSPRLSAAGVSGRTGHFPGAAVDHV